MMAWYEAYIMKMADLKANVELQPQQERVVSKISKEPGLLVYHGLGSGKTLASIAAAESLGGTKEIVVPASLRENYRKELSKFVTDSSDYNIKSYNKAVKHGLEPADITIFDEGQRMGREESATSQLPATAAGKRIILSGTPIRNHPSEIVPLLKAIAADRSIPRSVQSFRNRFMNDNEVSPGFFASLRGVKPGISQELKNLDELKSLLRGRVDYHPSSGEFPSVKEEDIDVPMESHQQSIYKGVMGKDPALYYKVRWNLPPSKSELKNLNSFLSGARQVSNNPTAYDVNLQQTQDITLHSPKMQRMIKEMQKLVASDPEAKGLIYSNYLDGGIVPLSKKLTELKIPNAIYTGQMSDQARKNVIDKYNKGKLKALLVSGAGSEGLDLKGTRLVQLMEPHWNSAREEQVIGRAVRHQSHAHLPEDKRNVKVQRFYSVPQDGVLQRWGVTSKDTSADHYIHNLAGKKQKLINQLLDVLKEVGSEQG